MSRPPSSKSPAQPDPKGRDTAAPDPELVVENAPDGIITVDRRFRITSFNRAAEEITGYRREDALGKKCADIIASSLCGRECAVAASMRSGAPTAAMPASLTGGQNGAAVAASIRAAPLLDREGRLAGGIEFIRKAGQTGRQTCRPPRKHSFREIISRSPAMQRLFTILPEISRSASNVLILGESGTGKELFARAIHAESGRAAGPFVAVNCGALPETLLESELFGYRAGAFTDARHDRAGRFAAARGGTIFLDEIGDIPPSLQVKLLRVLQEKSYEPLGADEPVEADVRVIAATNRDLATLVEKGEFRDDLYYRLNVVRITLPPLRERRQDIPLLCDHFVKKFAASLGREITGISDDALAVLMRHDFPGNIRELENIIEYAFILCHSGLIGREHLPEPFSDGAKGKKKRPPATRTLAEAERDHIIRALERNGWKRMATCRELGISKDTLRRKILRYGITPPEGG